MTEKASEKSVYGFNEKEIFQSINKFEEQTKEERKQFTTAQKFNDAILAAKKGTSLYSNCKGVFVGNLLLKSAQDQQHIYLMAWSSNFIIIVPFGPIQSVVHIMAIPKIPLYNAVSVGPEHTSLLEDMKASLVKVMTDILTPGSMPQFLYLSHLSKAFNQNDTAREKIRVTQKATNLDTSEMETQKAVDTLREMLKDYYDEKKTLGIPLKQVISTDVHLHDENSVGQLHMHAWIAEPALITDNGEKLLYKNTPMHRFSPLMYKHLGLRESRTKILVKVTNPIGN